MYSHYHSHQPTVNASGQQFPGFCFSDSADPVPEFFPSMNQPSSFDFYQPLFYTNNNDNNSNRTIQSNNIYTKTEYINHQQPFFNNNYSEMPFMGIQNYLSTVSYQDMHMMAAPPTTIPASPLSSALSSSSSPQMDDFLSMDHDPHHYHHHHHIAPLPVFENKNIVSPSLPTQPFSPHITTKKKDMGDNNTIITTTKTKPKKRRERKSMVPVLGDFFCDFEGCGKVFGRKYNLSSHLVTHYAERKFFCNHCPKAFVRRHDLKRHMRIHTGETPHKCVYCDRGFGRADALQRHYLTDANCTLFYNNDPLRNRSKKKTRSTGFGAKS